MPLAALRLINPPGKKLSSWEKRELSEPLELHKKALAKERKEAIFKSRLKELVVEEKNLAKRKAKKFTKITDKQKTALKRILVKNTLNNKDMSVLKKSFPLYHDYLMAKAKRSKNMPKKKKKASKATIRKKRLAALKKARAALKRKRGGSKKTTSNKKRVVRKSAKRSTAAKKAAATRKRKAIARSEAAKKAARTRKRRAAAKKNPVKPKTWQTAYKRVLEHQKAIGEPLDSIDKKIIQDQLKERYGKKKTTRRKKAATTKRRVTMPKKRRKKAGKKKVGRKSPKRVAAGKKAAATRKRKKAARSAAAKKSRRGGVRRKARKSVRRKKTRVARRRLALSPAPRKRKRAYKLKRRTRTSKRRKKYYTYSVSKNPAKAIKKMLKDGVYTFGGILAMRAINRVVSDQLIKIPALSTGTMAKVAPVLPSAAGLVVAALSPKFLKGKAKLVQGIQAGAAIAFFDAVLGAVIGSMGEGGAKAAAYLQPGGMYGLNEYIPYPMGLDVQEAMAMDEYVASPQNQLGMGLDVEEALADDESHAFQSGYAAGTLAHTVFNA